MRTNPRAFTSRSAATPTIWSRNSCCSQTGRSPVYWKAKADSPRPDLRLSHPRRWDPTKQDLSTFVRQFVMMYAWTARPPSPLTRQNARRGEEYTGGQHDWNLDHPRRQGEIHPQNIGHYGLAWLLYTFTSPIRRYPDVMVHRLLQHYLDSGKSHTMMPTKSLRHSRREKPREMERASIKYMQAVFLGKACGRASWGLRCHGMGSLCGISRQLLRRHDTYSRLPWRLLCIRQRNCIGESSGKIYQLGILWKSR